MNAPLLLIAAGGTGGHMFPAQALAEEMLRKGWRVKLSTDARGTRYAGGFPHVVEIEEVRSATFSRGGIAAKLFAPVLILAGMLSAIFKMRRDRPAVVVGFGGYPTIPALTAAWVLRVPRMIHEQNGVLGRVNKIFAKRVNTVACGTWPTALPKGVVGIHTGNPVRKAVLDCAASPYIAPGDYPLSVLVIGGSQGASALSQAVPPAIVHLAHRDIRVSHQAREEDLEDVQNYYAQNGISADVQTFFTDLPRRMSEAQLVISRAGASSVADITVIGRPSILIPYPHATDDHQTANAKSLARANSTILIPESLLNSDMLAGHIATILDHPEAAELMAAAALSVGKPNATDELVALVEALADKG